MCRDIDTGRKDAATPSGPLKPGIIKPSVDKKKKYDALQTDSREREREKDHVDERERESVSMDTRVCGYKSSL